MTVSSSSDPADDRDARVRRALLDRFASAGYDRVEPPILQATAPFLELGGEDIRERLYITSDADGTELCLRPEYTIPACRDYLASASAGAPAAYCYLGPVFRLRGDGPGEFLQAGVESFGRTDTAAADAEVLALTLDAAAAAGAPRLAVSLGDAGLLARFLDALGAPAAWRRRLRRGLERREPVAAILADDGGSRHDRTGLLTALAGADGRAAHALVEDLLSIAGITAVGGRTVAEIAERFLAQVGEPPGAALDAERKALVERYLSLRGDPDGVAADVRHLADEARLDLDAALDLLEQRTGFMAAQGIDVASIDMRTGFARSLDYYTGFVFEARVVGRDAPGGEPPRRDVVIGGGRYDGLAQALGSAVPVPAVGASIWLEGLSAGAGQP